MREDFSAAYIDGYIYIVGGSKKTKSAERLNLKTLSYQTSMQNAGILKYQEPGISVCGGWGKVFAVGCYSIQMCKIDEHIWVQFLLHDNPLWGKFAGCICVNEEQLLVFGGEGSDNCVVVSQDNATQFEEDHLPIQGAFNNNCCLFQGNIYAMKYVMKGTVAVNHVLVYDENEGRWVEHQ